MNLRKSLACHIIIVFILIRYLELKDEKNVDVSSNYVQEIKHVSPVFQRLIKRFIDLFRETFCSSFVSYYFISKAVALVWVVRNIFHCTSQLARAPMAVENRHRPVGLSGRCSIFSVMALILISLCVSRRKNLCSAHCRAQLCITGEFPTCS